MARDKDIPPLRYAHGIVASGGWCAPSKDVFDDPDDDLYPPITLPEIKVSRGALDFTDRRTDAEKAADEAIQALIRRKIGDVFRAQDEVINEACLHAMSNHWDIVVHRHPYQYTRFIGIGFIPQAHILPTIHEYRADYIYEWDED